MRYFWRQYNRRGEQIGRAEIDSSTITPLVDWSGRVPAPPAPAFRQRVGVLERFYRTDEIEAVLEPGDVLTPAGVLGHEPQVTSGHAQSEEVV